MFILALGTELIGANMSAEGARHMMKLRFCLLWIWIFGWGVIAQTVDEMHAAVFDKYPSAEACGTCHPDHYREWSVSPHAYSQISPVFNAFHESVVRLTNGTNGDFCIRCHTPVGMSLGEPIVAPLEQRHPISRQGVTCIACHRTNQAYGKVSGRGNIETGDIYQPVKGPEGNEVLSEVIADGSYKLATESDQRGRPIHREVEPFFEMTQPGFCGTCHDVNFVNGFRLEEAFSEYKTSPAAERGVTCQDCHMGRKPGVESGYETGPAAIVGDKPTPDRRRTNHMMIGPDYSIVHPGLFPHNPKAADFAKISDWLTFDWEAGWGLDDFEDQVEDDDEFPDRWRWIDDRYDGRDILEANLKLLAEADRQRVELLKAGYRLSDIQVTRASQGKGLRFRLRVENATDGHGVPTGFDAERLVFLRVKVIDPEGNEVFVSGDLDPDGDVRDSHSAYVHDGKLPLDRQLFSLQSRFLTRMIFGGEREQVLVVNHSPDPLPFVRPSTTPTVLTGRPAGARKHKMGIGPNGYRWAKYRLKSDDLAQAGTYQIRVELVAGMVPVNLVREIAAAGFDYGMTFEDVAQGVVAGHRVIDHKMVQIDVK